MSHLSRLLVVSCLIALAGCGSHAGATATPHVMTKTVPTATPQAATPATPLPVATATTGITATSTPQPSPSPTVQKATPIPTHLTVAQAPGVLSASIRPIAVAALDTMTLTVRTSGSVSRVEMYLSGGPGTSPIAYTLGLVGAGDWTGTGTAPAAAGQFHFSVGVYGRNGHRTTADNDAWNISVSGSSTKPPPSLTFPADIPLAPGFSYGNPAPATFSAEGQSVNGAEVTSTTQPNVQPPAVQIFYAAHLPRAGWAVDQSALLPPGATSFSIVGTMGSGSGSRVCIVQYGGSTIHIFYGTLA